jgi:hypothetical protein
MFPKPPDRLAVAAAALLALAAPALAQVDEEPPPVEIPTLPASAASAEGFAPPGWAVEAKATGDLDGDKRADLAFVLHGTDPKNVLKNEGLGPAEVDANMRILGVAVAVEGGFRLALQNATLIPRHVSPTMDDPFSPEHLAIARGAVKVELQSFSNAGGWEASNVAFTFRLREGRLELIGYDRTTTMRNSGETESVSVNYAAGRMSRSTGNISDDKEKKVWRKAPSKRGPTIEAIGDGFAFEAGT